MQNFNTTYHPPTQYGSAPPGETEEERRKRIEGATTSTAGYAAGGGGYNPGAAARGAGQTQAPPPQQGQQGYWTNEPGTWNTPGYGEDYYTRNQNKWEQPTQSQQYWNGVQGYYGGDNADEQGIRDYSHQIGETPSSVENLYDQYYGSGAYTNPGEAENYFKQHGGQFDTAGQGEQAIGGFLPQFGSQGQLEEFWGANSGKLQGPSYLEQHQGQVLGDIGQAHNMADFYGQTKGDLLQHGYTERMADNFRPEASYSENFLTGGGLGGGLDTLYDRLYEKGSRNLGNEAAARGGYNSGASIRATEELNKDLTGQHVKDYQAAVGAADAAKNQRLNTQLGIMTGADTGLRGRIGLGYQGSQGVDQIALARAKATQDLYTGMGGEQRANLGLGADIAGKTQDARLNRLNSGVAAGNTLDRLGQDRFKTGMTASEQAQRAAFDRMSQGMDASGKASDQRFNRLKTGADLLHTAGADQRSRYGQGSDLAGNADTHNLNYLNAGMGAASGAQGLRQNREHQGFEDAMTLGDRQAQIYQQQTIAARQQQYEAGMAQIQALLNRGAISPQEAQARSEDMLAMMKAPIAAMNQRPQPGTGAQAPASAPQPPGFPPLPYLTPEDQGRLRAQQEHPGAF